MATKLSKKEVINFVKEKLSKLKDSNTEFSSIIKDSKPPVWWFDISNDKFNSDVHLLLSDQHRKILYYFFIKSGSIKNPGRLFLQRNDKSKTNTSHIEIRVGDGNFTDILERGFRFKKYLKAEIKY